jgi:hypothetical protein
MNFSKSTCVDLPDMQKLVVPNSGPSIRISLQTHGPSARRIARHGVKDGAESKNRVNDR